MWDRWEKLSNSGKNNCPGGNTLEEELVLEQGKPTPILKIYRPVGFHSNPNRVHLIQQREDLLSC